MHCNKLTNGEVSSDPSKFSNNCTIKKCAFTRLVAGVGWHIDQEKYDANLLISGVCYSIDVTKILECFSIIIVIKEIFFGFVTSGIRADVSTLGK